MTQNHRPQPSRRAVLGGTAVAALTVAAGAGAGTANAATLAAPKASWPTEFPLPDGFLPEGITIGRKPYAYLGSRANGAILRTDLRTGKGKVIFAGGTGLVSVGLKLDDDGLLYVAGSTGIARIHNSRTGELVATHQLTEATGHFINDVILLGDRAWFTDSRDAVLHGVPRGRGGAVRALPLTGDWVQTPDVNNANGIVGTPDGRGLIVVKSSPGELYNVSVKTGYATKITLVGAETVINGDGLVRIGRTSYRTASTSSPCSTSTPRPPPPPCAARSPTRASTYPPPPPGSATASTSSTPASPARSCRTRRSTAWLFLSSEWGGRGGW
jgi:streptogramin lyase